jgi:hypothetical protein
MKTVLFACIHNAGRSQMAAAGFNRLADHDKVRAISAGTEPGVRVHPEVVTAMQEVGIELARVAPQKLTDELAATASHPHHDGIRGGVPGRSWIAAHGLAARRSERKTPRACTRDSG